MNNDEIVMEGLAQIDEDKPVKKQYSDDREYQNTFFGKIFSALAAIGPAIEKADKANIVVESQGGEVVMEGLAQIDEERDREHRETWRKIRNGECRLEDADNATLFTCSADIFNPLDYWRPGNVFHRDNLIRKDNDGMD